MGYVLYKRKDQLTEKDQWYLTRYLSVSEELKEAYGLKELYKEWFEKAKATEDTQVIKGGLEAFYRKNRRNRGSGIPKGISNF